MASSLCLSFGFDLAWPLKCRVNGQERNELSHRLYSMVGLPPAGLFSRSKSITKSPPPPPPSFPCPLFFHCSSLLMECSRRGWPAFHFSLRALFLKCSFAFYLSLLCEDHTSEFLANLFSFLVSESKIKLKRGRSGAVMGLPINVRQSLRACLRRGMSLCQGHGVLSSRKA